MAERLSTGSEALDALLAGGWEAGIISTVFGPAGSGKSLLCMLAALSAVRNSKKVVFIDTESNFSVDRLRQICPDYKGVLDSIIFMFPSSFEEQGKIVRGFAKSLPPRLGLIVVDTISMLYRFEFGNVKMQDLNRALGLQIGMLSSVARSAGLPVILSNQVYTDLDSNSARMVGGDILKYGSKCVVELRKLHGPKREAIIRKHRSLPEGRKAFFEIVQEGISPVQQG